MTGGEKAKKKSGVMESSLTNQKKISQETGQ
jgi:hypothetical protein